MLHILVYPDNSQAIVDITPGNAMADLRALGIPDATGYQLIATSTASQVFEITAPVGGDFTISASNATITNIQEITDPADGLVYITFEVSGSTIAAHNRPSVEYPDPYKVLKATLDSGVPIWLVDPVPTNDGLVPPKFFANSKTGLQIYPTADSSSVVVGYIVDGTEVATGPEFQSTMLQQDAQVDLQYRSENGATTSPVIAQVTAQAPVVWPANKVAFRDSRIMADLSGIANPTAQKFALVVWGEQPNPVSSDYLMMVDIDGTLTSTNFDMVVQQHDGAFRFKSRIRN